MRKSLHWIDDLHRPAEPGVQKVPGLGSVKVTPHDMRVAEAHGGYGSFTATRVENRGRQGPWQLHVWQCDSASSG